MGLEGDVVMKQCEIVPTHLAIQAMRDNGFKNAAYALAELIDNSIQAGATMIEMLCSEKVVEKEVRSRRYVDKIAVLDNGKGMDSEVLSMALQFGNGMYLDSENHTGIGRFGMGLPNSSISQCEKVEVWTWTDGIENAIYSYLDLEQIRDKKLSTVPEPVKKKPPKLWKDISKGFAKSGTLVVWSKIDKCIWRTAGAILKNSELLIGRMYRKFIDNRKIKIRMVAFNKDDTKQFVEKCAVPNDPIYLMKKTSCHAPYNDKPMFDLYNEDTYPIKYRGKIHEVKIKLTYACEESREGYNPGDKPHGRHASKNLGVSIVRAGRELDMDLSIVNSYDPTERWWGVEVEFPPALDDIFGVTNNKQSARYFSDVLKIDFGEYCKADNITPTQMLEHMKEDGDPHFHLIKIVQNMTTQLNAIRRLLKAQTKGKKADGKPKRHEAESKATDATIERQKEGHAGQSDEEEKAPIEKRKDEIRKTLEELGSTKEAIDEIIDSTFTSEKNYKYIFSHADLESPAFFSVKPKGGEIIISLNTNHPAYDKLFEVFEEFPDTKNIEELHLHIARAREALKLVLMAWARYEDEQPDGELRSRAQQIRYDWGTIAKQFLS
jgi:hypothetical protein